MGILPAFFYLILALAAFAVAAGLLVWVIRYVGRSGQNPGKHPDPADTSAAPSTGEQELLRVSRTQKGELAVFVRGRRYRHLREISDRQIGQETVEAIKAVLAFAEGWLPRLRQPSSQPDAGPNHRPDDRASTVDEEEFLERLRQADMFASRRPPGPSEAEPLIPVEAINELVQERLRERPDLLGQHVYLTTEANGNLRIYVGLETFESIDDIPRPEVRTLIQDAIHEWEGRCPDPADRYTQT